MTAGEVTAREVRDDLYDIMDTDASFEEKAGEALELGRQFLGVDNGHLTRIDPETDHWKTVVSTDPPDGAFPSGLELDLQTTYCRRTVAEGSPVALHDAPTQGWADDPAFEVHGLRCYHGTTLQVNDDPYGTVCFVSVDAREEPFDDDETMFIELITRLLERELEREQHRAELTRQTNLVNVLNRVLRHNLRNDMSVIRGHTQLMAEKLDEDAARVAIEKIDKLIELGEKARELERIVGQEFDRQPTDVVALVEDVVADVDEEFPSASFTVDADETVSAAVLPSFERAVRELIENGAKHGGQRPTVAVQIEYAPNAMELRIADDGPGLSEQEQAVLASGAETPLVHGSGLGLWLAHWIVTSHDGSIRTSVTDEGTTMTVSIPRAHETESPEVTKLRQARDRYQAAFEEASDAMVMINDDGRIVDANPAATTIYGMERRDLLGRSIDEFLPEEFDFESAWAAFQEAGTDHDTVPIVGGDGVTRPVEYTATTDIVPGQHLVIGRDVSEREHREAELRRTTHAMEMAPIGITISDADHPDNPLVYANDTFCELTGYDEDEILGLNCRFLQGEGTSDETTARIRRAIDTEEPTSVTVRNYRKDGTEFWCHLRIAPVRNDDGEVTSYVAFQNDITERIERERQLRRAETVFEQTQDAIFLIEVVEGPEFRVERVNQVYEELTGLSNAEVQGKTPREIVGDEIGAAIEARYRECLRRRETIQYPEEIPVDGELRQWETKLSPVIEDGDVVKLVGAMRDVTDRNPD